MATEVAIGGTISALPPPVHYAKWVQLLTLPRVAELYISKTKLINFTSQLNFMIFYVLFVSF